MLGWLEGNAANVTAQEKYGSGQSVEPLSVATPYMY
jgi:hypothetical protein